jgi:hypothetical protein
VLFPPSVYKDSYGLNFHPFERSGAGLFSLKNLQGKTILSTAPYLTDAENYPKVSDGARFADFVEETRSKLGALYAVCPTRSATLASIWDAKSVISNQFVTSVLTLDGAESVWSNRLHRKRRKQIEKGRTFGAEFRWGREELLDAFYEVILRTQTALGTPVHSKRYFESILAHVPESALVVGYVEGKPVSTALAVHKAGVLYHPYTGTLEAFLPGYLNCTLYWELILYGLRNQCTQFDLGRSFKGSGVHRFKSYWGAFDVPLYYCYFLKKGGAAPDLSAGHFKLATQVWSYLPPPLAKWIGPSLIWRIP